MAETLAEKLVKQVNKSQGEQTAYLAKDMPRRGGISSGSLALDYAIGPIGGFPVDRCIELFGPESSGKTTLALMGIANFLDAQKNRGALILDTEHKMESDRLTMLLGTDRMKRVVVTYPDHIEQAQDIYTELVPGGDICVALLDSIGGSPTKAVAEKSAEDGDFGNAKAVTRFARIAGGMAHKYECLTIGINQMRENLNPKDHSLNTPGGKGWRHACMLRVYLRKGKGKMPYVIGNDTVDAGNTVAGRIYKNHLGGIEGREFSYWFYNMAIPGHPIGVDQTEETVRLSTALGVVTRQGGWYYHDLLTGGKVNGLPRLIEAVAADEALRKGIAELTMKALRTVEPDEVVAAVDVESTIVADPLTVNNVLHRGESIA
jgi:recombination protein RecA